MTTYILRGWDKGADRYVTWQSQGMPDLNPTVTAPPLVGELGGVFIEHIIEPPTASQSGGLQFLSSNTASGTVPTLIGSFSLAAGTYPAPSAQLGCGNPLYIATLELRLPDSTVLASIGGVEGGVAWRTAAAGFVLMADSTIDLLLYTNADQQPAFIHGLTLGI